MNILQYIAYIGQTVVNNILGSRSRYIAAYLHSTSYTFRDGKIPRYKQRYARKSKRRDIRSSSGKKNGRASSGMIKDEFDLVDFLTTRDEAWRIFETLSVLPSMNWSFSVFDFGVRTTSTRFTSATRLIRSSIAID